MGGGGPPVRAPAPGRGDGRALRARSDPGRVRPPAPGPARPQRPARGARALARDRSEAARRRARVRDRRDRPRDRARPLEERGLAQARSPDLGARARPRTREGMGARTDDRVGNRPRGSRRGGALAGRSLPMTLRAVLFDVDFTLARPGPELGPEGYCRRAAQFGLELDPGRYEEARAAALVDLKRHPELVHDEGIWVAFTQRIVHGMGGTGERAHECAAAIERAWEEHANFDLYEDALPVLEELRTLGLKLALVSNGARNLEEFVAHHRLDG